MAPTQSIVIRTGRGWRRRAPRYEQQTAAAYDEVLAEVAARIATAVSVGKSDIGALLLWKRLRADTPWSGSLMSMPEVKVRILTARHSSTRYRRWSTPSRSSRAAVGLVVP